MIVYYNDKKITHVVCGYQWIRILSDNFIASKESNWSHIWESAKSFWDSAKQNKNADCDTYYKVSIYLWK